MCNKNSAMRRLGKFIGTLCGPEFKMLVMLVSSLAFEVCLQVVEGNFVGMAVTIGLMRLVSTAVLVLALLGIVKVAWREFTRA